MKKIVFTLLIFMVCTIQALAYEYFTIYFSDGTKSEAFYATDVDSICYSKLSLDGIAFDEWQVQEIYTCDSVYRYPLAQIDSLSFKDVDENKVAEAFSIASSYINPLYLQYKSSTDLFQHLQSLNIDGIEKIWNDNQSVFIKLRDWGVITYSYPPHNVNLNNLNRAQVSLPQKSVRRVINQSEMAQHKQVSVNNVCVITQMRKDNDYEDAAATSDSIAKMCREWGLNVVVNNDLRPEFFINGIRQYDLVFLLTHGTYNGNHWLVTNEEIYSQTLNKSINKDSLFTIAKEFIKTKYLDNGYSPNDVSFSSLIENRNGQRTLACYTNISNNFISKHKTPKSRNIIVLNAACQSMKGNNPQLANAFINTGTACYSGFTESNSIGPWTNWEMCVFLLNGHSIYSAYNNLPENLYKEKLELPENSGQYVYPELILWPENRDQTTICITHPETLPCETSLNEGKSIVKLKGRLKVWNPEIHANARNVGIIVGKTQNLEDGQRIDVDLYPIKDKHLLEIEAKLDVRELEANKTYYYRTYFICGTEEEAEDCYGEIKQFTIDAYYVKNNDIRTYFYDDMCEERHGTKIKEYYWGDLKSEKKVIFDSSFANYYPRKFGFMGGEQLEEIENLEYLKTDSIIDMGSMFGGCSSLTNLDLSNFNTSKVKDMSCLFQNCSSLTSIKLNSFNTSNVKSMWGLFYGCSSLTSLELSNFDTSNVTDMTYMFAGCDSLTNLDLSNFNTSKAEKMWGMFQYCSSLTSLDLSSFNTSNVTDMTYMFEGCGSLTNLDLKSFDTSNVTLMGRMFDGCSSLTSLDLSNFNTSNVTDMYGMFSMCSSMKRLDLSSFDNSNADMSYAFEGCDSLEYLDFRNLVLNDKNFCRLKNLKSINLSNANTVASTSMTHLFSGCSSLTNLDLSSFDTSNVTDLSFMFDGCSSLTNLDLSNFRTPNLTKMIYMFSDCISLEHLDLSNFDLSKIEDNPFDCYDNITLYSLKMENAILSGDCYFFHGLKTLREIDLRNAVLSGDCGGLFDHQINLREIDLTNVNTSNVTNMYGMFEYCTSLTSLDLSSFDMSNVKAVDYMFYECSALRTIYAGNWSNGHLSRDLGLFEGCTNLVGGQGTKLGKNLYGYDSQGNPLYYWCESGCESAHIDGGKDNPGLFTAK